MAEVRPSEGSHRIGKSKQLEDEGGAEIRVQACCKRPWQNRAGCACESNILTAIKKISARRYLCLFALSITKQLKLNGEMPIIRFTSKFESLWHRRGAD